LHSIGFWNFDAVARQFPSTPFSAVDLPEAVLGFVRVAGVWTGLVLVHHTVLTDENAPAMPAVFANKAEARAAYDKAIRAEWHSLQSTQILAFIGVSVFIVSLVSAEPRRCPRSRTWGRLSVFPAALNVWYRRCQPI
jgi:uncharacterized membrane protein YtjA (UPF0391 family)